ncbi:hypothetical protein GCM10012275_45880 [Longimycelium tulufanense]|uniref:ABM domain-containing protein n=1 Tax=Longimycelium tulufanense TaxID=907463 RepID=A0A8J3FYA5_9PSEU|nr:antibiotic biosynthesis monooxygenase [Longimycelium tulufanense]GGM70308.1 hypothetical protein GCM10012275_45880 [Longimycelium tulufanense]
MVLTIVELLIRKGVEEEFLAAYSAAARHVLDAGCRSLRLIRSMSSPGRFLLIGEWESVADHTEVFYASDGFVRWRDAVAEYFAEPPHVEHAMQIQLSTADEVHVPDDETTTGSADG